MVAAITATPHTDVAAVAVKVTGWFTSQSVTGSVRDGDPTFVPAAVGTNPHTITLPWGANGLKLTLDGVNTGGNDLDLYLYREDPTTSTLIASAATGSPDETLTLGRLAPGRYTAWVHGFNAVPVTGTAYTLTMVSIATTGAAPPVHVYRTATDIHGQPIEQELLGSPVVPAAGALTLWDTVAPLDTTISYRVTDAATLTGATLTSLTSTSVMVTGQGAGWLKDPAQPVNDIHFTTCPRGAPPDCTTTGGTSFQHLEEDRFDDRDGVFGILNAARPRSVVQIRAARQSTLVLLTHQLSDAYAVEVALRSGRVLLLQLDQDYGWAYDTWGTDYVRIGDVRSPRVIASRMRSTQRTWRLPLQLSDAPDVAEALVAGSGIGVSGATYADATAAGRTYAQRTATGNTYQDSTLGVGL